MNNSVKNNTINKLNKMKTAKNLAIQSIKSVPGEKVLTAGALTTAGGYVSIGIGVAVESAVAIKIGVAALYIGIGVITIGGVKMCIDEYNENKKFNAKNI